MVQECPEGLRLDQEIARAEEAARLGKKQPTGFNTKGKDSAQCQGFPRRLQQIRNDQFEAERALNDHIAVHRCMPVRKS
jgi:hypothetical protein